MPVGQGDGRPGKILEKTIDEAEALEYPDGLAIEREWLFGDATPRNAERAWPFAHEHGEAEGIGPMEQPLELAKPPLLENTTEAHFSPACVHAHLYRWGGRVLSARF